MIVCNDLFDTFTQFEPFFQPFLYQQTNYKVVLFNYPGTLSHTYFTKFLTHFPGQAYTVFSEDQMYNNTYIIHMVDLLLNHLEENYHEFDIQQDNFRLVGFGYGAYLIKCYMAYA